MRKVVFKPSPAVSPAMVYERSAPTLPVRTPRKVGSITLPAAAVSLGWQFAVGDATRDKAARDAVGVLMLCPATERYHTAPPLYRVRIGKRSVVFEVRAHGSQRCTGGRWERLDSEPRPRGAAALTRLLKWWHGVAVERTAQRDAFRLADAASRDPNRCATRPIVPNAPEPRPSGGSRGASGPKGRASHEQTFGSAPTVLGYGVAVKPQALPVCRVATPDLAQRDAWSRGWRP